MSRRATAPRRIVSDPGALPDLAIVETIRRQRYVVTYGRGWVLRAARLRPGHPPEFSLEAATVFDLSPDGRYSSARHEIVFFRGERYCEKAAICTSRKRPPMTRSSVGITHDRPKGVEYQRIDVDFGELS